MPYRDGNTENVSSGDRHATGDAAEKVARTVTGASGWFDVRLMRTIAAQLHCDAGTGTSPTLNVKFITSYNATDANAVDVPGGAFTQVATAASNQLLSLSSFHGYVKAVWTLTGTTPSFNFGVNLTSR